MTRLSLFILGCFLIIQLINVSSASSSKEVCGPSRRGCDPCGHTGNYNRGSSSGQRGGRCGGRGGSGSGQRGGRGGSGSGQRGGKRGSGSGQRGGKRCGIC